MKSRTVSISVLLVQLTAPADAFLSLSSNRFYGLNAQCHFEQTTATTALFSTPPRRPRRSLQKRRKRNQDVTVDRTQPMADDFPWDTAESRPLVKAEAQEAGEDYWIAEEDLQRQKEREKPPVRLQGQVSDEKLWMEILSPYKQNWIGLFSVVIGILAVLVIQFPELLQTPIISIPDL